MKLLMNFVKDDLVDARESEDVDKKNVKNIKNASNLIEAFFYVINP